MFPQVQNDPALSLPQGRPSLISCQGPHRIFWGPGIHRLLGRQGLPAQQFSLAGEQIGQLDRGRTMRVSTVLWVTSWAADHADKVAGLAGFYPVFDLRTLPWPAKAAPAYGLTPKELKSRLTESNPIERVDVLAKAKVPALLIHGDEDKVVPLRENSLEFAACYKAHDAEGAVKLIIAKGQGHNFWEGFFRCQELVDFVFARARAGKEALEKARTDSQ